ncbi:MAG TPA: A/G-specific adenine glycosylase [Candidatus Omnitrophota bacterium]|nr:A/G-specific adenine glycosylase [Candidatus Omnitrophota bacterium]HPT06909.1 A/G-specific adenine glycosylase [Candidatus Omnitrophota bacterium]
MFGRFRSTVWEYYARNKRPMPWRNIGNSYRVLVSEIMLQQTQVSRVRVKYDVFIRQFPTIQDLARASLKRVLVAWQGLGYNRRALLLHKLAREVVRNYQGKIPDDFEALVALPGIGKATAGSILAFAFNKPVVFIETNIRSVFIHHFFKNKLDVGDEEILPYVAKALDTKNTREWYYALMDYGVYLKAKFPNPSRKSKHYSRQTKFEGSDRQLRGRIVKELVIRSPIAETALYAALGEKRRRVKNIVDTLVQEGFVKKKNNSLYL